MLPPEPDPILNDTTIHGIDANKNGVRDDIEIYIYKNETQDWNLFNAYLQYFRNKHDIIRNLNNDKVFYRLVEEVSTDVSACIAFFEPRNKFNPYAQSRLFYNTGARKKASAMVNNKMRSFKFKLTPFEDRVKKCKFKVKK